MPHSKQIGAATLELVQGDLTGLAVDAIVNAANTFLAHGGGVAWAIVKRGGAVIQEESDAIVAENGPLNVGDAVVTSAGKLPAKFVIHAAGPIWSEKNFTEADALLRAAVRNSLALADERGLQSIALPAISTGIYHFPVERAARLILAEMTNYLRGVTGLKRVIVCLYAEVTYGVFAEAFAKD